MVRPVSPAERAAFTRKVKAVVALIVAASAGLIALGASATVPQAAAAVAVGLPVGAVTAWDVVPDGSAADRTRGA
jgi:hypothetical protein